MPKKPFLLLVNDDGIAAPGLHALHDALAEIAEIAVVAPASEMSAVGHAITISDPLRVAEFRREGAFFGYAVRGTPADCVKIGYWALLGRRPDAVVSGINLGGNTGINTIYSGTVSAATEGAILGVPSFAISLNTYRNPDFSFAGRFARKLLPELLERGLPPGVFLNVNVPAVPESEIRGVAVTRQGMAIYREEFDKRTDPHGRTYYWLTGQKVRPETELDVDDGAVTGNWVAVTPVHYDLTRYDFLETLKDWSIVSSM
ncbi:MAG TPA: 5'/3'-nucleotidase SurE [bacterium]|nr:5'/3'-nucleotidase SurE [bacterium]